MLYDFIFQIETYNNKIKKKPKAIYNIYKKKQLGKWNFFFFVIPFLNFFYNFYSFKEGVEGGLFSGFPLIFFINFFISFFSPSPKRRKKGIKTDFWCIFHTIK